MFTAATKIKFKKTILLVLLPISFLSSCSSEAQVTAKINEEELGSLQVFNGDASNYIKENWQTFKPISTDAKALTISGVNSEDYSLSLYILKNSPSINEIQKSSSKISSSLKENVLTIEMEEGWLFSYARTYECFSLTFGGKHYYLGLVSGPNEASEETKSVFNIDTSKIESIDVEQTILKDPGESVTYKGTIEKEKAKTLYANTFSDFTLLSLPLNGEYQTPGVSMYSFTVNLEEEKTLSFDATSDGILLYNRSYYALDSKGLASFFSEAEIAMNKK